MSELPRHIIVRELTIKVFDDERMTFEMDTTPVEPDPGSTAYTQVSRPVPPPKKAEPLPVDVPENSLTDDMDAIEQMHDCASTHRTYYGQRLGLLAVTCSDCSSIVEAVVRKHGKGPVATIRRDDVPPTCGNCGNRVDQHKFNCPQRAFTDGVR